MVSVLFLFNIFWAILVTIASPLFSALVQHCSFHLLPTISFDHCIRSLSSSFSSFFRRAYYITGTQIFFFCFFRFRPSTLLN
ncbi:hypothetical protein DFH27DRAFT_55544 [Peziza echinospora]|nr:hypothetical protein DFH27DRAFT_55544 [Peziza echinospora]